MGFPFGNDPAKIEGYRKFWKREGVQRPIVGFSKKKWFPLAEFTSSRDWKRRELLSPEMIKPGEFLEDQETLLREGELMDDGILRGACPLQGVPWLAGMLGCELQILDESIFVHDRSLMYEEIDQIDLPYENPWFRKYIDFIECLGERAQGRFPVGNGNFLGPSDMGAVLRGHEQMIFDLIDAPERASKMFFQITRMFHKVLDEGLKKAPRFHDGYFDAMYSVWAPEPIARLQEDNVALFSPRLYRDILQPVDRELSAPYRYSFMHLHCTSLFILDLILEVKEIRGFQMNIEKSNNWFPRDMVPYFRKVQEADRPLIIRSELEADEFKLLLDSLEPAGLMFYIMVQSMEEVERLKRALE